MQQKYGKICPCENACHAQKIICEKVSMTKVLVGKLKWVKFTQFEQKVNMAQYLRLDKAE